MYKIINLSNNKAITKAIKQGYTYSMTGITQVVLFKSEYLHDYYCNLFANMI